MSRSSATRGALACAIVASFGVSTPAARAVAPPGCEAIWVSPAYRKDHVLLCTHVADSALGHLVLAVSRDGGRSWRTQPMTGLVRPADYTGIPLSITLSSAFASDNALVATGRSGSFVSTDLGQTFTALDPLTPGGVVDNPVGFLSDPVLAASGEESRFHIAYASDRLSAIIDVAGRVRTPVAGVPGRGARRFSMLAGGPIAFVYESDPAGAEQTLAVYRCNATLTCAERSFAFPSDMTLGQGVGRVQLLPDGSVLAVLLSETTWRPVMWRSTDAGRTFAVWRPAQRLIDAVDAFPAGLSVSVAANTSIPRRLYLRVEGQRPGPVWRKGAPPASQVFRSDDGGTSWRRVAYRRGEGQPGPRGTLPWTYVGGGDDRAHIQLTPDGRLLAAGATDTLRTTFCSLDGGVRWTAGCPR